MTPVLYCSSVKSASSVVKFKVEDKPPRGARIGEGHLACAENSAERQLFARFARFARLALYLLRRSPTLAGVRDDCVSLNRPVETTDRPSAADAATADSGSLGVEAGRAGKVRRTGFICQRFKAT